MEDVIELLQESAHSVAFGLELPDDDDLVVIEEELLLALPSDLRLFLLEVSNLVIGTIEPVTVTDPYAHTHLPETAAVAWDLGVPRNLIPICQTDNGYYCIAEDNEIGFWRGSEQQEESYPSIWHWAKEVWLEAL